MDTWGRTIWIADAHHGDDQPFIVPADEKWTAFWNLNLKFALAAIELDEQTRFSANSASLNGSESGEQEEPKRETDNTTNNSRACCGRLLFDAE